MTFRVTFFGSPEFAVPALRALVHDSRLDVTHVVTQPDRRAGRGRRVVEPAVKSAARALSIEVLQPETLRSPEMVAQLSEYRPDLFVVVAFGEILRRSVLAIPAHGCLNVHPSLLPRYRGSSPIPAAILNGDERTGVSIIEMVRRLDAGPIVAQQEFQLTGSETAGSLSTSLANLSGIMLPDVAHDWCAGSLTSRPQEEEAATFTRELSKADGQIDWSLPAVQIERMVRAYFPWPTAWTPLDGRRIVVHSAEVGPQIDGATAGSIFLDSRSVLVACGSESLHLITIQPAGRKPMPASDWYRGLRADSEPRFDIPVDPIPNHG